MDKYFTLSKDLEQQLEEGLPVAEYLRLRQELKELYKQDAEIAEKRITSLKK